MKRNTEIKYEWCQYLDEELFTIRKITARDELKVFSKAEAIAYCERKVEVDG